MVLRLVGPNLQSSGCHRSPEQPCKGSPLGAQLFTTGSFERPEGLGPAAHSKVFAGKGLTRSLRKKGSYSDPSNYRGNTIVPAIDKLFAS
jgi:hypothetical protein